MPTIMLRGLPGDLVARVRSYADARRLSQRDAAEQILRDHMDHLDSRSAGAAAVNATRTADERSAAASKAAKARWGKT